MLRHRSLLLIPKDALRSQHDPRIHPEHDGELYTGGFDANRDYGFVFACMDFDGQLCALLGDIAAGELAVGEARRISLPRNVCSFGFAAFAVDSPGVWYFFVPTARKIPAERSKGNMVGTWGLEPQTSTVSR